jgi:phosphoenolpyruvate carboxykinase (ATP)
MQRGSRRLSQTARASCTCRAPFPSLASPRAQLRVIFVPRELPNTPSIQAPHLAQSAAPALAYPRSSIARLSSNSVVRMPSRSIKRAHDPLLSTATSSPLAQDFARQQVSKQQHSNFHSSSISSIINFNMVSQSVNKTNLHPSGVV